MPADQRSSSKSIKHRHSGPDVPLQQSVAPTLARVDPDRFKRRLGGGHPHPLQELQTMLRQRLLTDPALCRTQIFRACLPFLFFLSAFVIGVVVPRQPKMRARAIELLEDPRNHKSELMYSLLAACVGIVAGLVFLRIAVRVVVKLAISICELNLNDISLVGRDGDEQFELSESNLIIGGLFA